ncbi:MAG: glycosyltransferase [Alistipes sp.]|nr:glycosyltransferase [Alistipes senegalensis]MCM1251170.1 glycosyltransferase [Alistipes sp.]
MQPQVSVIIPVYNLAPYVDACLDSLSAQTFADFEAIVIDDGSTDDSGSVALRHAAADPRIRVIATPNGGVVAARERALKEARGAWIAFLDGDDTWEPDMLERLLGVAEGCDIVCCGYTRVSASREKIVRGPHPCLMTGREFLESLLCGRTWGGLCAKLYDRQFFDGGLRHYPLPLWEDMMLNVQIACASPRVRFVDYFGYRYLQRSGSASHGRFGFDYCRSFCETMTRELALRSAQLDGRDEFYATLNELRIYLAYLVGRRNPWNGDDPWVRDLAGRCDRYRRELKRAIPLSRRLLFRMNRRRFLRLPVLALATAVHWKESLVRRIAALIK